MQKEICHFHKLPLSQDNVGIFNEILLYPFWDDKESYFPNANSSIIYGCGFSIPSEANTYVLYCPDCRLIEANYLSGYK